MSETSLGKKATASLPSQTRAVGLKFIIVGALAVLMWIPALFLYVLSFERSDRASSVQMEIYEREGGQQRVTGPFLLIPAIEQVEGYRSGDEDRPATRAVRRTWTVLPQMLEGDITLNTEQRRRSIYSATVYEADIELSGRFDLSSLESGPGHRLLWQEARLVIGLTRQQALSGMRGTPVLTVNGRESAAEFRPGFRIADGPAEQTQQIVGSGISTPIDITPGTDSLEFALKLAMAGGGSFGLAPIGDESTIRITSDWPHPGFMGNISPLTRDISKDGFTAEWITTSLSRPTPRTFTTRDNPLNSLTQRILMVDLVTPDSPYSKINRSLKYALLFMGLIFLTVFILEVLLKSKAHPAQYILIGLAQVLFYLMVLALSEHISFDTAFLGMALVTVGLSGFYAASVFQRRLAGIIAAPAFAGVYGLIWLLMKSEDYALLIGASCAFTALAITMFVTRNIDWYGSTGRTATAE